MANVVTSRVAFNWAERLVEQLTHCDTELRRERRHKITTEIVVKPVNGDCTTFGDPFRAVTTDISRAGIGFLHTRTVTNKYVCVTFRSGMEKPVIVEVVRCRPVGLFYEIGGEFVRELDI